jgi:hypothetical protein
MDSSQENMAFPTTPGRPTVRLCGGSTCEIDWTPDARSLVVRTSAIGSPPRSRTFVVALRAGETLPPLPSDGIESESDLAGLRISRVVDGFVYPADTAPTVAFVRTTTTRNIYRVPLRP